MNENLTTPTISIPQTISKGAGMGRRKQRGRDDYKNKVKVVEAGTSQQAAKGRGEGLCYIAQGET